VVLAVAALAVVTGCLPRQVDPNQPTTPATFDVRPGTEEITVTGVAPGNRLSLVDKSGKRLIVLKADKYGQAHFAYIPTALGTYQTGAGQTLPTGEGNSLRPGVYTIRNEDTRPVQVTKTFRVDALGDHPSTALYDLQKGDIGPKGTDRSWFGYVTMRDGEQLSVNVRLPGPPDQGPYPTVVEYSGYGPSNPDATEPGSLIAGLFGYATVGVNMRGTGCSSGVFDVFNAAQQADGYDVIEAIARQDWVLNHKPGMVGLSYSGITQLYTAATQPPHLAAVTSLSVIKDPWLQQWPGGVYNGGFTREWLAERDRQSSAGGTSWVQKRIDGGDATCAQHQQLREQNIDFEDFGKSLVHRPADTDARDLSKLVRKIDVPVYLTGAWQDEQTGPQFADMLDQFENAPVKRFTLFNGRHPDGYTPWVLSRWYEFLELYVHDKVPHMPQAYRDIAPTIFEAQFGVPGLTFEPDRWTQFGADQYDEMRAAYEAEPDVRVIFENGTYGTVPGTPRGTFETTYETWPPPAAEPRTWYLGNQGTLNDTPQRKGGIDAYANDVDDGTKKFFAEPPGYQLLAPLWTFDWKRYEQGDGLSYVTKPFTKDTVLAGPGQVDLWISADELDADVQATVTIIRPDDTEYLVSTGLLRLGDRKARKVVPDPDDLRLARTYSKADYKPLPKGKLVRAKIAVPSFAQAFRAGDRLRIQISSPGRDFGAWSFTTIGAPGAERRVAHFPGRLSKVVFPEVSGITVPATRPVCPSLRGQACRPYQPLPNRTVG